MHLGAVRLLLYPRLQLIHVLTGDDEVLLLPAVHHRHVTRLEVRDHLAALSLDDAHVVARQVARGRRRRFLAAGDLGEDRQVVGGGGDGEGQREHGQGVRRKSHESSIGGQLRYLRRWAKSRTEHTRQDREQSAIHSPRGRAASAPQLKDD